MMIGKGCLVKIHGIDVSHAELAAFGRGNRGETLLENILECTKNEGQYKGKGKRRGGGGESSDFPKVIRGEGAKCGGGQTLRAIKTTGFDARATVIFVCMDVSPTKVAQPLLDLRAVSSRG